MVQTGHMMKGCTIVDATIINAPSSTKNAEKSRDPEMHQTKKGNEWRFGMKCHIGVDAGSGLVHTITVTAANVHDITQTEHLLREDAEVVYGDSGYIGVQKRPEIANNEHFSKIDFRINRHPRFLPAFCQNGICSVLHIFIQYHILQPQLPLLILKFGNPFAFLYHKD